MKNLLLTTLCMAGLSACAAPVTSLDITSNHHNDSRPTSLPANCVPNGHDGYRCPHINHPSSCVDYYSADGRQTGAMCP
ncbi:MAG: hypothetical protein RI964_1941 [Pseudomonadota bacterium]|jgi:hypothetical protein